MTAIDEMLPLYRALIEERRKDVAALESGRVRIFDGAGQNHEITAEWIERHKTWIAELEQIVAKYGHRNA